MKKQVPRLNNDEEAESFLSQDLSNLDFAQFTPSIFEFEAKSERVNMRIPAALLRDVKAKASLAGIPYQRFIRQALETAILSDQRQK